MVEGEFCVVCGATDRPLVDGICAPCAADRTALVRIRERVEVTLCPTCGARRVGQAWERSGASPLISAEDLVPFLEIHPEVGLRRVEWEETSSTPTVREVHRPCPHGLPWGRADGRPPLLRPDRAPDLSGV